MNIEEIKDRVNITKNAFHKLGIEGQVNINVMLNDIEFLLTAYEKEKEKNNKAKEFIKENSHEFNCKRDDLIELEFDDNTNATDLIDILDGNW